MSTSALLPIDAGFGSIPVSDRSVGLGMHMCPRRMSNNRVRLTRVQTLIHPPLGIAIAAGLVQSSPFVPVFMFIVLSYAEDFDSQL
jgi:hypothetical protein